MDTEHLMKQALSKELRVTKSSKQAMLQQMEKLKGEVKAAHHAKAIAEEKLDKAYSSSGDAGEVVAELEKQVEDLKSEKKESDDQVLSLEERIKSEQALNYAELDRIKVREQALYEAKLAKEAEFDVLMEAKIVAEEELQKHLSSSSSSETQGRISSLQQQVESLLDDKDASDVQMRALEEQVDTAQMGKNELREYLKNAKKAHQQELETIQEELNAAFVAKKNVEDELVKVKQSSSGSASNSADHEKVSKLEKELEDLKAEKKSTEDQVLSLESEMDTEHLMKQALSKELRVTKSSKQAMLQQMEKLKGEVKAAHHAKAIAEEKLDKAYSSSGDAGEVVAELEKQVEDLKSEKKAYVKQIENEQSLKRLLQEQFPHSAEEGALCQYEELDKLRANPKEVYEQITSLKNMVKVLVSHKSAKEDELQQLETNFNAQKLLNQTLKKKILQLTDLPFREKALVDELNTVRLHSNEALQLMERKFIAAEAKSEALQVELNIAKEELNAKEKELDKTVQSTPGYNGNLINTSQGYPGRAAQNLNVASLEEQECCSSDDKEQSDFISLQNDFYVLENRLREARSDLVRAYGTIDSLQKELHTSRNEPYPLTSLEEYFAYRSKDFSSTV